MKTFLLLLTLGSLTLQASDDAPPITTPESFAALQAKKDQLNAQLNMLRSLGTNLMSQDQANDIPAFVWTTCNEHDDHLQEELNDVQLQIAKRSLWQALDERSDFIRKTANSPEPGSCLSKIQSALGILTQVQERIDTLLSRRPSISTSHTYGTPSYQHSPSSTIATEESATSPSSDLAKRAPAPTLSFKQLRILCFSLLACISLRYLTL